MAIEVEGTYLITHRFGICRMSYPAGIPPSHETPRLSQPVETFGQPIVSWTDPGTAVHTRRV